MTTVMTTADDEPLPQPFWRGLHQARRSAGLTPCRPLRTCPICMRAVAAARAGR